MDVLLDVMWDDDYVFLCEAGHTVSSSKPNLDACTVLVYRDGELAFFNPGPGARPCGATMEARIVPYTEIAE